VFYVTWDPLLDRRLWDGVQKLGLHINTRHAQCLLTLVQLLDLWDRTYNLTAVRNPLQMVAYHLLDSLALIPYLRNDTILDLGTGAGFPGLPLAIVCPDLSFTLLDSNGKKIRFVRQVVMELGLHNVQVVQSRIESYMSDQKFATIVARALAPLSMLLRWVEPLILRPGVLLAPKGRQVETEINELIPNIGTDQVLLHQLRVPYVAGKRILVQIDFL
jgi:16S rRNA (guanine527-N7)-methyltransferase